MSFHDNDCEGSTEPCCCTYRNEIEVLRRKLAAAKEVPMKYKRMEFNAQLQNELAAMTNDRDGWKALHHTMYYQPLAASQAREQKLREALQFYTPHNPSLGNTATEALALPQDDTALRQWGAKLLGDAADRLGKGETPILPFELRRMADELEGKT